MVKFEQMRELKFLNIFVTYFLFIRLEFYRK